MVAKESEEYRKRQGYSKGFDYYKLNDSNWMAVRKEHSKLYKSSMYIKSPPVGLRTLW